MNIELQELYGQLKVTDSKTKQKLPKVYVKVFAENKSGNVSFYKDGYTDLRGKFDYATKSGGNTSSVKRFAILVVSKDRGS